MPSVTKPGTGSPAAGLSLDQGLAAWIADLNEERRQVLYQALGAFQRDLDKQDRAFAGALREIDWVRDRVGAPEHLVGSSLTKHGEIAEIAEVGIRNARSILEERPRSAFWSRDGAGAFGPEDYGIDGEAVQSKFVNGAANTLRRMVEHAEKYPDFRGYYRGPKDYDELFRRILSGDTEGVHPRTVKAILGYAERLTALRGQPFGELVRSASHTYAEVQQGRIHETLANHDAALEGKNEQLKGRILEGHRDSVKAAEQASAPTAAEWGQVAATGAAVGAGLQLTTGIYRKWKHEGRRPTQFTSDDWFEIGGFTLSGAATGAVSASALYALTNYSALSAPLAAAVVSSGRAMATLARQYQQGEISFEEFSDLSVVATAEAGITAAGALLGQTIIPIPIVGAVIGSATARLVAAHARSLLAEQGRAFEARLESEFKGYHAHLEARHRSVLEQLEAKMRRLADLTELAFDLTLNTELLLVASIALAEAHGVPGDKILRSTGDVDRFMMDVPMRVPAVFAAS